MKYHQVFFTVESKSDFVFIFYDNLGTIGVQDWNGSDAHEALEPRYYTRLSSDPTCSSHVSDENLWLRLKPLVTKTGILGIQLALDNSNPR